MCILVIVIAPPSAQLPVVCTIFYSAKLICCAANKAMKMNKKTKVQSLNKKKATDCNGEIC